MKINQIHGFLVVLVLLASIGKTNEALLNWLVPLGEWSTALNWLLGQIPALQDDVEINTLLGQCNANFPTTQTIFAKTISIGPNASTLNLNTGCNVTGDIKIMSAATINFNLPPAKVCGAVAFRNEGLMNNIALLQTPARIFNSGIFLNNNEVRIGGGIENSQTGNLTSSNIFSAKGKFLNAGYASLQGTIQMNQNISLDGIQLVGNSQTLFDNCNFNSTYRDFSINGNSTLKITNSPLFFLMNPLPPGQGGGDMGLQNWEIRSTSKVIVTSSNFYIVKFTIAFLGNTSLSLNSAYFNTSHRLAIRMSGSLESDNSFLVSPGPLIFNDQSVSFFRNNSYANTPVFGVGGNASVTFLNSNLSITNGPRADIPEIVGLNSTAVLKLKDFSVLNLDGTFLVNDDTNLIVSNGSSVFVSNSFAAYQTSNVLLELYSEIKINSSMLFYDYSTFTSTSSKIDLIQNFYLYQNSSFDIMKSIIHIDGNLGIQSSESTISNSTITILGIFGNGGKLTSIFNDWDISDQLLTNNSLLCNNSNILVRNGVFSVWGEFIGSHNNITVLNGSGIVNDNSQFTCELCYISIENGKFLQGIGSSISMVNSTFNNKNGVVEALGNITVNNECDLSNDARFILSSNILVSGNGPNPNGPLKFNNRGTFEVTKNNDTQTKLTIGVPFKNSGILKIANDVDFEGLEQEQLNSVIELNNVILTSKSTVMINSGNLKGIGSINGNVTNDGGILGFDKEIMKININGTYAQSNQSNVIISVNSRDEFSFINITGSGQFGGNITILINTDNFQDSKENETISLIEYYESQGEFSNVKIQTYSEKSEEESSESECGSSSKSYTTSQSSSSFALLLNSNTDSSSCGDNTNLENKNSKISNTTIIAVTVSVGGFLIIGSISAWFIMKKFKYSKVGIRLRQTLKR